MFVDGVSKGPGFLSVLFNSGLRRGGQMIKALLSTPRRVLSRSVTWIPRLWFPPLVLCCICRTTSPNIYACGDCASPYKFTHAADWQVSEIWVRFAVEILLPPGTVEFNLPTHLKHRYVASPPFRFLAHFYWPPFTGHLRSNTEAPRRLLTCVYASIISLEPFGLAA